MKVAVVGAGSTYTPELVEGFVAHADRLPVDELALLDVDAERLEVVGGLAERILARQGWAGGLTRTLDPDAALEGASFVVAQIRVGGQAARLRDETIPLEFGCIGQETTGPGGFAKALRTVPVILDLAQRTADRGAPGAWFVDFTNPVGIVTQALLDAGHRAIGLCNVAITLRRRLAALLDVPWERVELEHVGLNHLTWVRAVRVDGADVLPDLLEGRADEIADEVSLPGDLLRLLGAIPSYYLRYYYAADEVLAEEQAEGHRPRAEEVASIERDLLDQYRDPALDRKPDRLSERGGSFYSEAAVRLMASLHAGTGDVQEVNVRNRGALPSLADDDVVEIPARIDRDGAHPQPLAPLAPELLGLVEHVKAYERLTVDAAISGSRAAALKGLATNPLVPSYNVATRLLDAILDANRPDLPRFFADDGA
ncbi:MAG TPA: 6-phospho-beta-glucosidase [Actinomycetota bacterium]|nr:6-phospho-beta-glucosidase [Actinomycetota bacterium]